MHPTFFALAAALGSTSAHYTFPSLLSKGVTTSPWVNVRKTNNFWAGDGAVWFKNVPSVSFTLPEALPSGDYLIRMEAIALHAASTLFGAQLYISCGQINITGGGSGTPGPKVAIPGVYTGNEPGILIDIYYPVLAKYTMPGPAVWSG